MQEIKLFFIVWGRGSNVARILELDMTQGDRSVGSGRTESQQGLW